MSENVIKHTLHSLCRSSGIVVQICHSFNLEKSPCKTKTEFIIMSYNRMIFFRKFSYVYVASKYCFVIPVSADNHTHVPLHYKVRGQRSVSDPTTADQCGVSALIWTQWVQLCPIIATSTLHLPLPWNLGLRANLNPVFVSFPELPYTQYFYTA